MIIALINSPLSLYLLFSSFISSIFALALMKKKKYSFFSCFSFSYLLFSVSIYLFFVKGEQIGEMFFGFIAIPIYSVSLIFNQIISKAWKFLLKKWNKKTKKNHLFIVFPLFYQEEEKLRNIYYSTLLNSLKKFDNQEEEKLKRIYYSYIFSFLVNPPINVKIE